MEDFRNQNTNINPSIDMDTIINSTITDQNINTSVNTDMDTMADVAATIHKKTDSQIITFPFKGTDPQGNVEYSFKSYYPTELPGEFTAEVSKAMHYTRTPSGDLVVVTRKIREDIVTTLPSNQTNVELDKIVYSDAPQPWQLGFQDSASPSFAGLVELHDTIGFYLIVISIAVFWALFSVVYYYRESNNKISYKYLTHGTVLELVWTITPAIVLIAIGFPSFKLLYMMDEVIEPSLTIKVVGHQWYWSYELSDYITDDGDSVDFDSYMIPESDLELGQFRILDVDNRLTVPVDCHVRFVVTGADVIHSLAVPSLGLKLDCVPGRLNQVSFLAEREGVYYGQCSEICGVWHGFMPIVVEAVQSPNFLLWLKSVL